MLICGVIKWLYMQALLMLWLCLPGVYRASQIVNIHPRRDISTIICKK